jgi:hypothetical protein
MSPEQRGLQDRQRLPQAVGSVALGPPQQQAKARRAEDYREQDEPKRPTTELEEQRHSPVGDERVRFA